MSALSVRRTLTPRVDPLRGLIRFAAEAALRLDPTDVGVGA